MIFWFMQNLLLFIFSFTHGEIYIKDDFNYHSTIFESRWIKSKARDKNGVFIYQGEFNISESTSSNSTDKALTLLSSYKNYGIAKNLDTNFFFNSRPLIVQYEVAFKKGWTCSGAYIKLISASNLTLEEFDKDTEYTIMFGPDKCGEKKFHLIIKYKNPIKMDKSEEKHANLAGMHYIDLDDESFHLIRLTMLPHGIFFISIDQAEIFRGNLLSDFIPSIVPTFHIDDPSDNKPVHWDDREFIEDLSVSKPDLWDENQPEMIEDITHPLPDGWLVDEPMFIVDETSKKPNDWDEHIDGEWKQGLIKNPKCSFGCGPYKYPLIKNSLYKGKWIPPLIKNPDYKGQWSPRKIENPKFFNDSNPFENLQPISGIYFELWTVDSLIMFDNMIISDSFDEIDNFTLNSWNNKQSSQKSLVKKLMNFQSIYSKHYITIALIVTLIVILVGGFIIFKIATKSGSEIILNEENPKAMDQENSPIENNNDTDTNLTDEINDESIDNKIGIRRR